MVKRKKEPAPKRRGSSELRDRFAGEALHGVIVTCASTEGVMQLQVVLGKRRGNGRAWMAKLAYQMADAMLVERAK
jgi:hypothetical protein